MEELKDYVFYTILKSEDMLKEEGIAYGIKRGKNTDHNTYFRIFLDIDSFLFEGVEISRNWSVSCENIARNGNIIIVNTAIEIETVEDRMYGIYLPTFPNLFQLQQLESVLIEFSNTNIDVSVYGEDEVIFRELRMRNEFDSLTFLRRYIKYHKERLQNKAPNWYEHHLASKKIYALV